MKRYGRVSARPAGSAVCHGVTVEQYHAHDFTFSAGVSGNPFDAEFKGDFQGPGGIRVSVPGFYDGDGTWKIRFSPTSIGQLEFTHDVFGAGLERTDRDGYPVRAEPEPRHSRRRSRRSSPSPPFHLSGWNALFPHGV